MIRIVLALFAALVVAAPARAGLGDAIPAPFTKQLFNVPGVINDGLATVISCSSGLSTSIDVGVEWFRKDGTSVVVTTLTIPAGTTRNFGTTTTAGVPIDGVMAGADTIKSGAARVLSTTPTGIFCDAFVMETLNDPPTVSRQLLITGAKKQKGQ